MKRLPLEGKMIGLWKVISYEGCDGKKSWYLCECTKCGKKKLVRADKLRADKTRQCAACRAKQID